MNNGDQVLLKITDTKNSKTNMIPSQKICSYPVGSDIACERGGKMTLNAGQSLALTS